MTAKIIYQGNLRTEMTHVKSGSRVSTDAPVDNQGKGECFSPTDLVATALGSCMMTIMGIKARDMNIDITGTSLSVTKHMSAAPRKIAEIKIDIQFPQALNTLGEKEKTILQNAAHTCPVAKSLHPDVKQNINFIW